MMTETTTSTATAATSTPKCSAADLDVLRTYTTKANHGRGRLVGSSRRLAQLGLLTLTWTSATCWVLTLSARGKQQLDINA